ncbi:hypothetical protein RBB76_24760 [Tunturiibacter psychrotolerans]|uniref:hypothetical protein n=1 Tax=Tunturiibacter psychrotolerans TaxID=3069686 RepID=UPI003D9B1DF5
MTATGVGVGVEVVGADGLQYTLDSQFDKSPDTPCHPGAEDNSNCIHAAEYCNQGGAAYVTADVG